MMNELILDVGHYLNGKENLALVSISYSVQEKQNDDHADYDRLVGNDMEEMATAVRDVKIHDLGGKWYASLYALFSVKAFLLREKRSCNLVSERVLESQIPGSKSTDTYSCGRCYS